MIAFMYSLLGRYIKLGLKRGINLSLYSAFNLSFLIPYFNILPNDITCSHKADLGIKKMKASLKLR